jgi:uncharacterized protein YjbI with pentapeptide repeats
MFPDQLLSRLKQGGRKWNRWRLKNSPGDGLLFFPRAADLSKADLEGANLRNVSLLYANLSEANLKNSDLTKADLSSSNLIRTQLNNATLVNASLRGGNLSGANLSGCNLNSASLEGAVLATHYRFELDVVSAPDMNRTIEQHRKSGRDVEIIRIEGMGDIVFYIRDELRTDLSRCDLQKANLINVSLIGTILEHVGMSQAILGNTTIDCDLSSVAGLEDTRHQGPSTLSNYALLSLKAPLPQKFLQGCGLSDEEINFARARLNTNYYSCFISYSSKDAGVAKQLHSYLRNQGVHCWFAPEDLKIGEKFRNKIETSIRQHDKLLLILSNNSISSPWVEEEVESALEREHREKGIVLFPIRIDDSVMNSEQAWAASLRRMRHIGDFTNWKDAEAFHKAFNRLMRDLRPT